MIEKLKDYVLFSQKIEELADEFVKASKEINELDEWHDKARGWANFDIESFLRAISRYVLDKQELFDSDIEIPEGMEPYPKNLEWDAIYNIILAGKFYE